MHTIPINPMEPEVKVSSFHGPSGERSVNVIATIAIPTIANGFHSVFPPMPLLRGATLESDGVLEGIMAGIEDAIIVAGGLGSRMLPASGMVAKESLPLVDIPAITHLAREAVHAGVKKIHIITSPKKDFSKVIGDNSWISEKREDIDRNLISPFHDVEVEMHIQNVPRGLGDAINCALSSIKGPFLVLLGDNILLDNYSTPDDYIPSNASKLLVDKYAETNLPCVGLIPVNDPENYGVVAMNAEKIISIVEKPERENSPSNLVLCGRYLFTSDTADLLSKYNFEKHGELQSIAIQKHWMENDGLIGVEYQDFRWYDSGNPTSWLKGQIEYALNRKDLSKDIKKWLDHL